MKGDLRRVSRCGRYDCSLCEYHTGVIAEAAARLLDLTEGHRSMRLIAESSAVYDFGEYVKALRWLASRVPCRGCRSGGGWSWWLDCPVRDCTAERKVDFCYQCGEFPCGRLGEEPLLERKRAMIRANERIRELGLEEWATRLGRRYREA